MSTHIFPFKFPFFCSFCYFCPSIPDGGCSSPPSNRSLFRHPQSPRLRPEDCSQAFAARLLLHCQRCLRPRQLGRGRHSFLPLFCHPLSPFCRIFATLYVRILPDFYCHVQTRIFLPYFVLHHFYTLILPHFYIIIWHIGTYFLPHFHLVFCYYFCHLVSAGSAILTTLSPFASIT